MANGNPDGYEVLAGLAFMNGDAEGIIENLDLGINQGGIRCIATKAVVLYRGLDTDNIHIEEDEQESYRLLTSVKWTDDYYLPFEYLGHFAKNKDDYFLAKEYYERVLKINPTCYYVMSSLGDILRNVEGLIDYQRAFSLLHQAAINGDADGMNSYALMLYFGENGNEDKETALEWMRKSAELGYTQAMINLGDIYADIYENPKEARSWFQKAADAGDPQGEERLKDMHAGQISKEDVVQNMFDHYLNDEENILKMPPSATSSLGFPSLMKKIQNVIESEDLSDLNADRLRILQGFLSLYYFKSHFFDEDFSEKEDDYYAILDKVDDYI